MVNILTLYISLTHHFLIFFLYFRFSITKTEREKSVSKDYQYGDVTSSSGSYQTSGSKSHDSLKSAELNLESLETIYLDDDLREAPRSI